MKIIILQTNSSVTAQLGPILQANGYTIETVDHADGIVERLVDGSPPDLLLVDCNLGEPGFSEICRALKNDPEFTTVPILAVETEKMTPQLDALIDAGCDDILCHPVDAASFLMRVRALVRLRKKLIRLDDAESVLYALARGLEAKDPYTQGHMDRVASYAVELGKRLGVHGRDLEILRKGGMLHDVGKIAIPDAVLTKPGRYTPEEFAVMKKHPALGCQICEKLRSINDCLPIIRHHHERLDGTGYPDGLKGPEIPMLVRIVTVVDIYDALRSKRSYKEAFGVERSFEILWQEAGQGWWDRDVVAAWEKAVRERSPDEIPAAS